MSIIAGQWGDRACRGLDTELFYPPRDSPEGGPMNRWELCALAVCEHCPVREACLEAVLEFPGAEQHGVAGGMTAGQRRQVLRLQRRQPTRSYLPALVGRPAAFPLPSGVDGLAVARLVAGDPAPGATPVEVAHAAIELHRAGHTSTSIARQLGVQDRQVLRWVERHRVDEPLVQQSRGRRPAGAVA